MVLVTYRNRLNYFASTRDDDHSQGQTLYSPMALTFITNRVQLIGHVALSSYIRQPDSLYF